MNRYALFGILGLIAAGLSACSPGLGKELPLSDMTIPGISVSQPVNGSIFHAQVRPFIDNRADSAIAEIDGRKVQPSGDVAQKVQDAFQKAFDRRGVTLGDPDAPILGGQIVDWSVLVRPAFPASEAEAQATVVIEVSSLQNQIVYRGKYSGNMVVKHPLLNESRITEALAQAMAYAIEEALKDEKLMDRLARAYHPIS